MANDLPDLTAIYRVQLADAANDAMRAQRTDELMSRCARVIALAAVYNLLALLEQHGAVLTIPEKSKGEFLIQRRETNE